MKASKKENRNNKKLIDRLYKELVEKHKIQTGAYFINAQPNHNSKKPFIR